MREVLDEWQVYMLIDGEVLVWGLDEVPPTDALDLRGKVDLRSPGAAPPLVLIDTLTDPTALLGEGHMLDHGVGEYDIELIISEWESIAIARELYKMEAVPLDYIAVEMIDLCNGDIEFDLLEEATGEGSISPSQIQEPISRAGLE